MCFKTTVACIGLLFQPVLLASEASFRTAQLYEGDSGGYKIYRIPGVVVTKVGSVLAYTEARRTGNGDWD
ncbi:MAG: glycoside hydrolase, partial [Acidobacteriota bacterium]|nr:glycoside hydrolase [Acidobacteriota bacterium]